MREVGYYIEPRTIRIHVGHVDSCRANFWKNTSWGSGNVGVDEP